MTPKYQFWRESFSFAHFIYLLFFSCRTNGLESFRDIEKLFGEYFDNVNQNFYTFKKTIGFPNRWTRSFDWISNFTVALCIADRAIIAECRYTLWKNILRAYTIVKRSFFFFPKFVQFLVLASTPEDFRVRLLLTPFPLRD